MSHQNNEVQSWHSWPLPACVARPGGPFLSPSCGEAHPALRSMVCSETSGSLGFNVVLLWGEGPLCRHSREHRVFAGGWEVCRVSVVFPCLPTPFLLILGFVFNLPFGSTGVLCFIVILQLAKAHPFLPKARVYAFLYMYKNVHTYIDAYILMCAHTHTHTCYYCHGYIYPADITLYACLEVHLSCAACVSIYLSLSLSLFSLCGELSA